MLLVASDRQWLLAGGGGAPPHRVHPKPQGQKANQKTQTKRGGKKKKKKKKSIQRDGQRELDGGSKPPAVWWVPVPSLGDSFRRAEHWPVSPPPRKPGAEKLLSMAIKQLPTGEFLLRHSGLRIRLQWLRSLRRYQFDPQPCAVSERIQHCHSCRVGCSCSSDSTPGPGTSICPGCAAIK